MKSFMKSLKRQDGFTLVELMVVVAIIGLLSAVAIPNFKKYQSKAKVSEAKLQLSAAYMAEQSFFSDFNLFSNCLSYMGYDPANEVLSRYYAVGFSVATDVNPAATHNGWKAAVNSGLATTCAAAAAGAVSGTSHFPGGKGVGAAVINTAALHEASTGTSALGAQDDTTSMTFTISVAGVISPDGSLAAGTNSSALSMTDKKIISTDRLGY